MNNQNLPKMFSILSSISVKHLGGKMAPKLVYFVLGDEIQSLSISKAS